MRKTGFSLLEMSIVILIIGFLVVAIATAKNMTDLARLTRARALTNSSVVIGIKDLSLWLETTSLSSFTSEEPDDASSISTWKDINSQGTIKNNATAGSAPTYIKSAINRLPALRFNGSSSYLNFDGTFLIGSNYTIFVVEQRRATGANYFVGGGTTVANSGMHLGYRSDTASTHAQYSNDYDYNGIPNYTGPIPRIHSYVFNNASGKFYRINGVQVASRTDANGMIGMVSYTGAKLGLNASGSTYFNGDIGEIIMFSRALTDFERGEVETYLSKKWNIT